MQGRMLLDHFMATFIQKSYKPPTQYGPIKEPKVKVFALATRDLNEYRFHMGQFRLFQEFLSNKGFDAAMYIVQEYQTHQPKLMNNISIKPIFKLRDRQPDVVDFILKDLPNDHHSRLVTLSTGYGKGLISLWGACQRQFRLAYIILPAYLEKTILEIKEKTTATDKNIMVVQGGDSLRGLIHLGKTGEYKSDIVLISMKTWTLFLDSYSQDRDFCVKEEYGCAPEELYKLLGIGTVIIDEIHQHLHAVYRTLCFMDQDRAIGLSATFLSADSFIDNIQKIMFPREIRFETVKPKKYIFCYGISYLISEQSLKKIRTTERGASTYSQNAYEVSILKNPSILANYFKLLLEVFNNGFMDAYKPGHKCIIFCRRVDMCEQMVMFLKQKFPQLDIRKFTQEDPYENLQDPDVRITTQQSAGTAHDIPGLVTNITFDNMSSQQASLQCLGRLREIPDVKVRYYAVFSESIPKHVNYQRDRKQLFNDRVAAFKEFQSKVCL